MSEHLNIKKTPIRLSTPEDGSKYYNRIAKAYHMSWYNVTGMCPLKNCGLFSEIRVFTNTFLSTHPVEAEWIRIMKEKGLMGI